MTDHPPLTNAELAAIERRWTVEPRLVYELQPHKDGMPPLTLPAKLDKQAPDDVLRLIAEVRQLRAELSEAKLQGALGAIKAIADWQHSSYDEHGEWQPRDTGEESEP